MQLSFLFARWRQQFANHACFDWSQRRTCKKCRCTNVTDDRQKDRTTEKCVAIGVIDCAARNDCAWKKTLSVVGVDWKSFNADHKKIRGWMGRLWRQKGDVGAVLTWFSSKAQNQKIENFTLFPNFWKGLDRYQVCKKENGHLNIVWKFYDCNKRLLLK